MFNNRLKIDEGSQTYFEIPKRNIVRDHSSVMKQSIYFYFRSNIDTCHATKRSPDDAFFYFLHYAVLKMFPLSSFFLKLFRKRQRLEDVMTILLKSKSLERSTTFSQRSIKYSLPVRLNKPLQNTGVMTPHCTGKGTY